MAKLTTNNRLESLGMQLEDGILLKKQPRVHCPVVMPRNPKLIRGEPVQDKVIGRFDFAVYKIKYVASSDVFLIR